LLYPVNKYIGDKEPWKVVKTDPGAAALILHNVVEGLRIAAILLKPFIPRSAEAIYRSFNFPKPWEAVSYADAALLQAQAEDLRVMAELVEGKPKPLFPRIA
jgi:methionyl-tRNA synthetase